MLTHMFWVSKTVAEVFVCVLVGGGGPKVFFSQSKRDHPHRATVSINGFSFYVFFALFYGYTVHPYIHKHIVNFDLYVIDFLSNATT